MKEKKKEGEVVLLDVRDPDEWDKKSVSYDRLAHISRRLKKLKGTGSYRVPKRRPIVRPE